MFVEKLRANLTDEGMVSFECKVVGFPTPVLTWLKDGRDLRPGDVYQLYGNQSIGVYTCVARNCMGEARSVCLIKSPQKPLETYQTPYITGALHLSPSRTWRRSRGRWWRSSRRWRTSPSSTESRWNSA